MLIYMNSWIYPGSAQARPLLRLTDPSTRAPGEAHGDMEWRESDTSSLVEKAGI